MKRLRTIGRRLAADRRAASAVEFALLAPVFFTLMFGVVGVGIYMQNFNAIRSLASDASRWAAVEFQQNRTTLTATDLEEEFFEQGTESPYFLNGDLLTVDVQEVTPSRVNGAREFDLNISYTPAEIAGGIALQSLTMNYSRPIFVLDN